jgi:tetrahydromethanopterin S-methyltransferase subunit F
MGNDLGVNVRRKKALIIGMIIAAVAIPPDI